jgi:hypothetical protein
MTIHIGRREFIAALVAWPFTARAQQLRQTRIGILHPGSPPDPWLEGLRQGFATLATRKGTT